MARMGGDIFSMSTETPPYTPQGLSVRAPDPTVIHPVREGDFEFEDEEEELQTTLKNGFPTHME
jgi:hypothetical protein